MKRGVLLCVAALLVLLCAAYFAVLRRSRHHLPYQDHFALHDATEWTPLGGQWQMQNDAMVNRSDEDGAKLVTGYADWSDYALTTDLKLVGQSGNMGVIVRVNDEELGTDSYSGYYVGLRSTDSAFVVGRADHGWLGGRPTLVRGGVQPGVWYRLQVVVVGCRLAAQVTNLQTGASTQLAFEESSCERSGRVGLRSIGVGGAWRHVRVVPATDAQRAAIAAQAAFVSHPEYPIREDDYSRMMEAFSRSARQAMAATAAPTAARVLHAHVIPIASGKAASAPGEELTFRGVVTLTSPLYIQDQAGGGIHVITAEEEPLNLGDEIQVTGTLSDAASLSLGAKSLRVVGQRTSVAPVAITVDQAADGAFDGRLVELSGRLVSSAVTGDQLTMSFQAGEQSFVVQGRGLLSPQKAQGWEPGSILRVSGICLVGDGAADQKAAFTILLRSLADVNLVSGPSWSTPRRFARLLVLCAALAALGLLLYLRADRSKMRAILEERERLAQEMHDTLAQSFAGVGFHLQGVRNSLRSGALPISSALEKLDVACQMVTRTHREASEDIAALHPYTNGSRDLLQALERTTHAVVEANLPSISTNHEGIPREMSLAVRDALFKVGRESISNILRHSRATEIVLKLQYGPRGIILEIRDNGCGFAYGEHFDDFGMRSMRRRLQRVGGQLQVRTEPGVGTCVQAHAPYGTRFSFLLPRRRQSRATGRDF